MTLLAKESGHLEVDQVSEHCQGLTRLSSITSTRNLDRCRAQRTQSWPVGTQAPQPQDQEALECLAPTE